MVEGLGEELLLVGGGADEGQVTLLEVAGELLLDGLLYGIAGQLVKVLEDLTQLVLVLGREDLNPGVIGYKKTGAPW